MGVNTRLELCDVDAGRVQRRMVEGGAKHCTVRADCVSWMHSDVLCAGRRSEKQKHYTTFLTLSIMGVL